MTSTFKNNRKSSALLTLAILLIANTQSFASAPSVLPSKENSLTWTITKSAALFLIAAGATRFFTREGDNSPARYDWDKIKNGQELPSQLFYLFDDGIGHMGNKPYDEVNKDNNRVERRDYFYPKGIGGWTAYYYKSVLSALGATWVSVTALRVLCAPGTTQANFLERFFAEVKKQAEWVGIEPTLEIAVPLAGIVVGSTLASAK